MEFCNIFNVASASKLCGGRWRKIAPPLPRACISAHPVVIWLEGRRARNVVLGDRSEKSRDWQSASYSGPSANYFFSFLTIFFDLSKHAPVFSAVTIFHIFPLIGETSWRCGEDRAPPSSCSASNPNSISKSKRRYPDTINLALINLTTSLRH